MPATIRPMTRRASDGVGMSSSSHANGSGAVPAAAAGQREDDHSPTPVVGASSTNGNDAIAGNNATSTSGASKDAVAEGGIMNEEGGNDAESPDATPTTGNGKKQ